MTALGAIPSTTAVPTTTEADAAYQPKDSDLTAIAAIVTTAFGRGLLTLADAAALLAAAGAAAASHAHSGADITSGTVVDARIDAAIARDSEVASLAALVKLDDFAAPDDNTDLNASTSKHGLLQKLPGGTSTFLRADGTFSSPAGGIPDVQYETRSTNTILGTADKGKAIDITATITQTFEADETLGDGWWVILRNATSDGTTIVTCDPAGTETIDALTTTKMYSGETRLIVCNGAGGNFNSYLLEGGFAKFAPGVGAFIVPAGIKECEVVVIGAGGQGGGGASSVSTAKSGGAGGGGGAVARAQLRPADLGAAGTSITVTVGAGGAAAGGGGAAGAGAAGTAGTDGAQTTFGTLLKAGGGGGGVGGTNASVQGGGGGSVVNSAVGLTAGAPASTTAIGGQGSTGVTNASGNNAEWGGASGSGGVINSGANGGGSMYGGPGGGSGGNVTVGNVAGSNGGPGGSTQRYTNGGGGAGGTGSGTPTAGSNGATLVGPYCGSGGGGGGAASANVTGVAGGIGGIGAGGGGGGAACSATSSPVGGNGGAGGPGECRVWFS